APPVGGPPGRQLGGWNRRAPAATPSLWGRRLSGDGCGRDRHGPPPTVSPASSGDVCRCSSPFGCVRDSRLRGFPGAPNDSSLPGVSLSKRRPPHTGARPPVHERRLVRRRSTGAEHGDDSPASTDPWQRNQDGASYLWQGGGGRGTDESPVPRPASREVLQRPAGGAVLPSLRCSTPPRGCLRRLRTDSLRGPLAGAGGFTDGVQFREERGELAPLQFALFDVGHEVAAKHHRHQG